MRCTISVDMALGRWYLVKWHHIASTWHVFQNTWCPMIGSSQSQSFNYLKRMVQWQMTQLFLGLIPKANDDKRPMIAGICHCKWWKHVSSICLSKASSFHPMYKTSPGSFPNFCFWWATCFFKVPLGKEHWRYKTKPWPHCKLPPFLGVAGD